MSVPRYLAYMEEHAQTLLTVIRANVRLDGQESSAKQVIITSTLFVENIVV